MRVLIKFFKYLAMVWFDLLDSIFRKRNKGNDESPVTILKLGNDKFLSDIESRYDRKLIKELAETGQKPHAVVVACSDSRVAPERLLGASLGDLFIVRTAGNVVGDIAMGSIEYAVISLEINTIIVMGHRKCGAVAAAANSHGHIPDGQIKKIIEIIEPSVERAKKYAETEEDVLTIAENFNILNTIKMIKQNPIVIEYMAKTPLKVVAAKVDILTGKVAFFD